MPRYLVLRRSGVHRAACFALYRAILRQKHKLQLNEHHQHLFRKPIRAIFKRNSKLQSPPQISTALQLGYETLDGLNDGVRQQRLLNRILELASPASTSAQPEDLPSSPQTKIAPAQKTPRRHAARYPGARRTLDRPFFHLSGRRHVPKLINANRVPFLRLKKPQPPFLSRVIRDTVKTREHRILRAARLTSELPTAADEDEWDEILDEQFESDCRGPEVHPWQHEVQRALDSNHKLQVEAIQKRADISANMYTIQEQEKALAEEEKLRIRDKKHKATKARRLARRGLTESEVQERLYPQIEDKEVAKQGQEEARQPKMKQEWRLRGGKYKTSDELRRIKEASLRPKTDAEIAKIKEARARRKEEESEKKAEKLNRKQENASFWEQKLNKATHSTNKRLGSEKQAKPPKPGVVRRNDYESIQPQPEIPPLLDELVESRKAAVWHQVHG